MSVEGGIVTGQVTASLDGLTRGHLRALREVIVNQLVQRPTGSEPEILEVREAIDQALREWDVHNLEQGVVSKRVAPQPACGVMIPHASHQILYSNEPCAGVDTNFCGLTSQHSPHVYPFTGNDGGERSLYCSGFPNDDKAL